MFWIAGIMTGLHLVLAFTPLYDLVVTHLISAPPEVIEPARLGLQIMLPYALAIAYRRFNYGTLIRFGYTKAVTIGVVVRLCSDVVLLALFHWVWPVPGIIISTATFTTGIVAEAVYSFLRVQPVIQRDLRPAPPAAEPVTLRSFLNFYIPLMLTSLLQVIIQPMMSAAISRMPNSLDSLAVWPVVFGFLILWTSAGQAYLEVVVVLLDEPQAVGRLRRFAVTIAGVSAGLLLVMVGTPLAGLWFSVVVALPASLLGAAVSGLVFLLPLPGLRVFESFYQGTLVNARRTRGVTEAVVLNIFAVAVVLWLGVWWGRATGLYVALLAALVGEVTLAAWLRFRAGSLLRTREQAAEPAPVLSSAQGA
jgi:hypothetical protein